MKSTHRLESVVKLPHPRARPFVADGANDRSADIALTQDAAAGALGNTGISRRGVRALTPLPSWTGAGGAARVPGPRRLIPAASASVPEYIRRCPNSPWERAIPYKLLLWPRGEPGKASLMDAHCRSWRCEGDCQRHSGRVAWARIVQALEKHDENDVLFCVLSLDRDGFYSGEAWADSTAAYRALSDLTAKLLKRLNRLLDRLGAAPIVGWVGVIEQHRSGWPHANLIIVCPGLAAIVDAQQAELDEKSTYTAAQLRELANSEDRAERLAALADLRERALVRGEVLEHVTGAGWGPRSSLERARSRGAVAGYVVKMCGLHDQEPRAGQVAGEVAKLSQVPTAAPVGFRRLRSSVGFLPPRRRSGYTGALLDRGAPLGLPGARALHHRTTIAAELEHAATAELREFGRALARKQRQTLARFDALSQALEVVGLPAQPAIERYLAQHTIELDGADAVAFGAELRREHPD